MKEFIKTLQKDEVAEIPLDYYLNFKDIPAIHYIDAFCKGSKHKHCVSEISNKQYIKIPLFKFKIEELAFLKEQLISLVDKDEYDLYHFKKDGKDGMILLKSI